MWWHETSWPTIDALPKDRPVVIPLGACEQHGRHLPVFVDTIQVTAIAEQVERRLAEQVIVTPTFWLGSSHHHLDFPGTVSVRPTLYTQVIQDVARSILRAGFRRLFFLNGHGGNEVPGAQALADLVATDDLADAAHLTFASWWQVGGQSLKADRHDMASPQITHACEYETSMMLFLRPDLVQQQLAQDVELVLDKQWCVTGGVKVFRRFHRLTDTGNMGSPSTASSEKGQSICNAVVDDIVAFLESFAGWPDLPAQGPVRQGGQ
ncbi:creatininase family protein [Phycisphaerales bacterium AB-hyl4]|uniref:Creatininase family protein n=1 Tax=Natronomicrosphaera hydrolytica TaxID=3242702 RepID=A0ABV4U8V9_9BACT